MKESIIFIHGLTGSKRAFKKQIEYFNQDYHTYTYDLLGHGEHIGKHVHFTLDNLVKQLEAFYDANGIKEAHICSLSYSCYPSAIFANKWKERVKSLCFIGGHYNAPSKLLDVLRFYWNTRDEDYDTWLKKYSNDIYPTESILDLYSAISKRIYYKFGLKLDEQILKNAIWHRLNYDLRSHLERVTTPVLWVMGEYDSLYKSTLTDLKSIIPHVIYKEIKHAGHAANLFRPNCFRDIYENFLVHHTMEKMRQQKMLNIV